jgi:tetratricopeptide (TPR) repeat protein
VLSVSSVVNMHASLAIILCMLIVPVLAGCTDFLAGRAAPASPATAGPQPPTQSQQAMLDEAQRAKDAGDYDAALAAFRGVLAENPTIAPAYVGIGEIFLEQQDYARAEPIFSRAARLEPRNFDAQFGHGLALQMLGRFVEAVRAYQRALTINPMDARANLNLATTYLQLREARSSLIFAERAVEADPQNGPARVNLGSVYEQLGRNAEAIDQYLIAMELIEDDTAPLMLNLINVLGRERRFREAVNTAEHLVRIAPSANAYERLAWGYFRIGAYDKSIDAYRTAVEHDPNHWPSWSGIGVNALNAWLLSDRTDGEAFAEARRAFRRSLQLNPEQPRLVMLMSNYGL